MNIETKYNIEDEVYTIFANSIDKMVVHSISIIVKYDGTDIEYNLGSGGQRTRAEKHLYKTEIEAAEAWLKQAGIDISELKQGVHLK